MRQHKRAPQHTKDLVFLMTRKELSYLLILLPERAKSKGDLSGADDDTHTLQTEPADRAVAKRGQLMGVTREFRLLPDTALARSRGFMRHFFKRSSLLPTGQVGFNVLFMRKLLCTCVAFFSTSPSSHHPIIPSAGGVKGQRHSPLTLNVKYAADTA